MSYRLHIRGGFRFLAPVAVIFSLLVLASCGKKAVPAEASKGPHVKWSVRSAGTGVSHPAIGPDGTIYIGTSVGVQAFSPSGSELWRVRFAAPGTPVISSDGTLYFESSYGFVLGVSSAGQLVWQPKLGLSGFHAPPAIAPDASLYYVNTASDIYAFQPRQSDNYTWTLQTFREGLLSSPDVLPGTVRKGWASQGGAPLLLGDSTLIVPRQNFLHSIGTNGSNSWELELTSGDLGEAAIAPDSTIYVGDNRSVLYAVDPAGSRKWRFDAGGSVLGSPEVDTAGVIYFTDGSALYAVNPDGSLHWRYSKMQQPHFVTPATLAADGTIYIGSEFGLNAFRPDGTLKWNLRVYSPSSPLTIAPDGTVYFACGYFWLCAAQGDGAPLMQSSWPKPFHDLANTSRYSPAFE
ncbi:MAG TPA: PQQ-binding-like beta-propeller repeat protein [Candidatus Eisenbacteria bacterium]|nr:PQQ-binding-like beta-propeller repeat protein [Candidatus Eisenbacteria bacterium]